MNLLIIDATGLSLDFALRCQAFGHKVKVFVRQNKDGSRSDVGNGLVERVPHWEDHMNWADLIFCTDNVFYIHALERYRDKGYPIFGPSIDTNRWEQDRQHGAKVMERAGIDVIPSQEFSNYDDAIKLVMETNKRYVSKPLGDGNKALSYVSKTPADMVYMLQKWKKSDAYKGEFILQEFHGGIEIAIGGWFGPNGFSKHWCINHEYKKLLAGDLGVSTGEEGTIVYYTQESLLADKVLKPLEDYLAALGYTGYIDVNSIINEKSGDVWPLEFTMRPGWPLFTIQQALHRGDPAGWMLDLLDGKDTLKVSKDIACGVVVTMPDYPYDTISKKDNSGYPLFDLTMDDATDAVHLQEVQWGKAPAMVEGEVKLDKEQFVTAGSYVCVVTGTGKTVEDATEDCYDTIKKKIKIPNSIGYRVDIGHKLEKELPILNELGYSDKKFC